MSAVAGWYDDGSGRDRWWDGATWTEHFRDTTTPVNPVGSTSIAEKQSTLAGLGKAAMAKVQGLVDAPDHSSDPDTIWSAVGKPLTGMGAGRYRLTAEWFFFEKGTLSNKGGQVRTHELFDVDVSQSLTQKTRGVGTIKVQVIREDHSRETVLLEDVPDFRDGVVAINDTARDARLRLDMRSFQRERALADQVQTINYTNGAPVGANVYVAQPNAYAPQQSVPAATAAPVIAGAPDMNAEIGKLVAYRESGVLTEEEFTAAKKQLLGL